MLFFVVEQPGKRNSSNTTLKPANEERSKGILVEMIAPINARSGENLTSFHQKKRLQALCPATASLFVLLKVVLYCVWYALNGRDGEISLRYAAPARRGQKESSGANTPKC